MTNPKVSCYCATYGRTKLLEEAIHSFLLQDYEGEKELVILNDFSEQTLFFDHPEVKIINSKERITPLSKKFNDCISYCTGKYVFVWEDDDIYLPWKISLSIKNLNTHGIFHTGNAFIEHSKNKLVQCSNLHHSSLCMDIDCWNNVNFYSVLDTDKCDLDVILFQKISSKYGNIHQIIKKEEIFYIYRFGTSEDYHGSSFGTAKENISDHAKQYVEDKIKNNKEPVGEIILNPNWKYDYLEARNISLNHSSLPNSP